LPRASWRAASFLGRVKHGCFPTRAGEWTTPTAVHIVSFRASQKGDAGQQASSCPKACPMCLAHLSVALESRSAGQVVVGCCGRRSGRGEEEGELEQTVSGCCPDRRPVQHSGSDAGSSIRPRHVSEYAQRRTSSCDHTRLLSISSGILFLPLHFLLARRRKGTS
jgi:hypothetical protein